MAAADDHKIPIRVYWPVDRNPVKALPAVYWIHGGGMVLGDLDMSDPRCETYVGELGCVVVSVDYRLAPEHPHPAPVEDCYTGLGWLADHASDLGVDPTRILVAGFSAGGGLAAGTCLLARDRDWPAVTYQCLISPMLDDRNATHSAQEFSDILSWGGEQMGLVGTRYWAMPPAATTCRRTPLRTGPKTCPASAGSGASRRP